MGRPIRDAGGRFRRAIPNEIPLSLSERIERAEDTIRSNAQKALQDVRKVADFAQAGPRYYDPRFGYL